ncbi:hypothetical protein ACS0TY_023420 [Phlomoides rotata]
MENLHSQGWSTSYSEMCVPTFKHQKSISINWNSQEKSILQEGLVEHASVASIFRYCKIAARLQGKTARDVALRVKWMTKKERCKRGRQDNDIERKYKDRKTSEDEAAGISSIEGLI